MDCTANCLGQMSGTWREKDQELKQTALQSTNIDDSGQIPRVNENIECFSLLIRALFLRTSLRSFSQPM